MTKMAGGKIIGVTLLRCYVVTWLRGGVTWLHGCVGTWVVWVKTLRRWRRSHCFSEFWRVCQQHFDVGLKLRMSLNLGVVPNFVGGLKFDEGLKP